MSRGGAQRDRSGDDRSSGRVTPRSTDSGRTEPRGRNVVALVLVVLILAGLLAGTVVLVVGGGATQDPPIGPDVPTGP